MLDTVEIGRCTLDWHCGVAADDLLDDRVSEA